MKISWLTNVQAPYRAPMFRELSDLSDFEAFFFFRDEKVRHWTWSPHPDYSSRLVPSWRIPVPAKVHHRLDDEIGVLRPLAVSQVLKDADAMVTQVWWQPAHLQAIAACRRRGIPYLVFAESTMDSRSVGGGPADRLRSFVFRNAGAVIVPGPAAAEAAARNGTPAARIVESVNSVDIALYRDRVQQMRGEDTGPHRFAYVGQLIARKNVSALLRAFAALPGDPVLEIAGDGGELPMLRGLADRLGVNDRVRFLGFLEEEGVLSLLARSHTLVLPSTEEVYGYTALEAHVAGLQVVVSEKAGIARSLAGRSGTWVVPPTVDGLASGLGEARDRWKGWQDDVDVDFASPRRVARDIVRAAELAATS